MRSAAHRLLGATMTMALLASVQACAHAPARPLPVVTYPPPPAAPRARLAGVFPDPDAVPTRRSFWRALADTVTGLSPRDRWNEALVRPFGLAVSPDGALLVADPDAPGVLRVESGGAVARVRCRGREWNAPMGVDFDDGGTLLVADAGAAEIVLVAADGSCRTLGAGELERPTGAAPMRGGKVVVVDPPRHQLVVFAPSGEVAARWGRNGDAEGELNFPTAVARAPDGTYLVVDALNFRIVRFDADGGWVGAFGTPGSEGAALGRPKGVAVDEDGRIYVSDAHRDLVLVFGPGGAFEYAVGAGGEEPGAFSLPAGVAVRGRMLRVADSLNRRVQTFELVGGER